MIASMIVGDNVIVVPGISPIMKNSMILSCSAYASRISHVKNKRAEMFIAFRMFFHLARIR